MADRVLPSREITWCETHFAGAVEKMAGCLVWRERGMAGPPDCSLVDRLLVDREAIEKKQLIEQFVGTLDERERYLHDAEFHALIEVLVVTLLDLPNADLDV